MPFLEKGITSAKIVARLSISSAHVPKVSGNNRPMEKRVRTRCNVHRGLEAWRGVDYCDCMGYPPADGKSDRVSEGAIEYVAHEVQLRTAAEETTPVSRSDS
jgi:hypothetical protein